MPLNTECPIPSHPHSAYNLPEMPYGKRRTISGKRYNQLARAHDMEYLRNALAFCCIADQNSKPYVDYCTESDSDLELSPKRVTFAPLPVSSNIGRRRSPPSPDSPSKSRHSKRNLKRLIVERSRRDKEKEQEETNQTTEERQESNS